MQVVKIEFPWVHLNIVVCLRFLNKYDTKYQVYEVADNVRNLCQILDNDVAPAVQILWQFS